LKDIVRKILFFLLVVTILFLALLLGGSMINDAGNNIEKQISDNDPLKVKANAKQSQELIDQARQGNLKRVIDMLDKYRFNTNFRDSNGQTALMAATYNNRIDVAKRLMKSGFSVNAKDNIDNTPYLYAAAEGYTEILKAAIPSANVRILNRFGGTGLIPAAEKGHVENVKLILEKTTTDINHVNKLGWTALLEAVMLGKHNRNQAKIVKLLVDHHANKEIRDNNGLTAIDHAKRLGYKNIVKLLQ
jgi:uncharacterized protein